MPGLALLWRSYVRRDRWALLWWPVGLVLLFYSQTVSVDGLYLTRRDYEQAAATIADNPALVAMSGPARALDTLGGQVAWQTTAFAAVLVALMSMFLVGRHTRAEEESGRDELVRAAPVDRRATTAAALLHALVVNVAVGALVAVTLVAYPLAAADSVALGLGLTLVGWFFSGVALLAAQLASTTRAMYGLVGATIGVAYVTRAVGDVGPVWVSWLSPIGWYQGMHAFSGLRWWPAAVLLVSSVLVGAAAFAVFARRDFGLGVLPPRPGPACAGRWLAGPFGLAWNLQRAAIVGWTGGLLLTGLAFGSMGDQVGDLVGESQAARELFGAEPGSMVDGFYATAVAMMALIVTGFAVSSALRPRGEEESGHAELVLATALTRRRWLLCQVAVTVLGCTLAVAAGGAGLGVGYAVVTGDGAAFGRYLLAALPQLAAVLVLAALARLLHGAVPGLALLAWVGPAIAAVVLLFGELLDLPAAVQAVSPFHHLARVPLEQHSGRPVLFLLAVAAALSALGQFAFGRRDLR